MKFNCGLTAKEQQDLDICRYSNWHNYFAWVPIRVGHKDCRWLEWIERKGRAFEAPLNGVRWNWEYRAKQNDK